MSGRGKMRIWRPEDTTDRKYPHLVSSDILVCGPNSMTMYTGARIWVYADARLMSTFGAGTLGGRGCPKTREEIRYGTIERKHSARSLGPEVWYTTRGQHFSCRANLVRTLVHPGRMSAAPSQRWWAVLVTGYMALITKPETLAELNSLPALDALSALA